MAETGSSDRRTQVIHLASLMNNTQTKNFANCLKALSPDESAGWRDPKTVAAAFGWDDAVSGPRALEWDATRVDVSKTQIGPEPASLFASLKCSGNTRASDLAALYAYHSAARWGALVDEDGIQPFCPQWRLGDRWYFQKKVNWEQIEEHLPLLSALQPEAVRSGASENLFLSEGPTPTTLRSIDDELVAKLDARREEALSYSSQPSEVDQQLQTLYARLFVLRIIEDKGLDHRVPNLKDVLSTSGSLDIEALTQVFQAARAHICADLFSEINLAAIPDHTLSHIIDDLYVARNVPGDLQRYNFSWIDSDILGFAYEKYLSTVLNPLGKAAQSDLFFDKEREVSRHSVRKSHGVYYTPSFLTKFTAQKAVDDFLGGKVIDPNSLPKIIDFACGSGSFLVAAFDTVLERLTAVDPTKSWAKHIVDEGTIFGVDIDESAVTLARLNLWNRMTEEPDPLPLPSLSKTIIAGDGLSPATWLSFPKTFDVVLGNPPFLTTSRIHDRASLEERFETAKGRYDYSYLFVEQAIKITEPSGTIGMIVPNRLFRNKSAGRIREVITARMNVIAVVDFGSVEVFSGVGAYVGCIVAKHRELMKAPADSLEVIEVSALPENFIAAFLLNSDTTSQDLLNRFTSQHPRGPSPWLLMSPDERLLQTKLREASIELGELSEVFQGIRTGANDIFIVEVLGDMDDQAVTIRNGFGDTGTVETRALRPITFGSSIQKYEVVSPEKYLIYPYHKDVPLSEGEMERSMPLLQRYLKNYRDLLANRSSIKGTGQSWFELVRRRDESWLSAPKLVIRDLAPETSFAVDLDGGTFLVGGTAVIPPEENQLMPLLGYLNSRHISELLSRSTPQFRGEFQKFEPRHLTRIPVLRKLIEDDDFADQIEYFAYAAVNAKSVKDRRAAETQIDELIGLALFDEGLDDA